MPFTKRALAAVAVLLSACSANPNTVTIHQGGATINALVHVPFATLARPMVASDVNHYTFKLIRTSDSVTVKTGASTHLSTQFTTVPNGTYKLSAEAFSSADDSVSITAGGPIFSSNTVTVAASGAGPFVTYTSGSALTVDLTLLGGTGETVANQLTVHDGADYSGGIGFTP